MRKINLTKYDIECCDDIYVEPSEFANFTYELWFDVDEYFGTNIKDDEDKWINFYTSYKADGSIVAEYFIDSNKGSEHFIWELTEDEKVLFKNMMEEYCEELYDCTLDELLNEEE